VQTNGSHQGQVNIGKAFLLGFHIFTRSIASVKIQTKAGFFAFSFTFKLAFLIFVGALAKFLKTRDGIENG